MIDNLIGKSVGFCWLSIYVSVWQNYNIVISIIDIESSLVYWIY